MCFKLPAAGQVQSTVRELRENAFRKFGLGEFDAAIPDLLMLIDTLKLRRNRAATFLVTSFLKTLSLDDLYPIIPYLLKRDSQAARSIVFNLSAMEARRYREGCLDRNQRYWSQTATSGNAGCRQLGT